MIASMIKAVLIASRWVSGYRIADALIALARLRGA